MAVNVMEISAQPEWSTRRLGRIDPKEWSSFDCNGDLSIPNRYTSEDELRP